MKRRDFEWTRNRVEHTARSLPNSGHLATKALGVLHKHFLVPIAGCHLEGWKQDDHYRHHLSELEDTQGDSGWIRPWIAGGWLDDSECLFEFEPTEFDETTFAESIWAEIIHWRQHHSRGALFGIYLTVERESEGWRAVFGFRLEDSDDARTLNDLPVREALCLAIDGDVKKVEAWLDWAYRSGRVA